MSKDGGLLSDTIYHTFDCFWTQVLWKKYYESYNKRAQTGTLNEAYCCFGDWYRGEHIRDYLEDLKKLGRKLNSYGYDTYFEYHEVYSPIGLGSYYWYFLRTKQTETIRVLSRSV